MAAGRLIEWFVSAKARENAEATWRARFLSQSMLIGVGIAALMCTLYATLGNGALLAETAAVLAFLGVGLVALRLGVDLTLITHVLLALLTLSFTLGPMQERHFDGAALGWFCIIPFLAVILIGRRAALAWGFLALGGMVVLFSQPDDVGPLSEAQRISSLGRSIGLSLTISVFALAFRGWTEETRERLERVNHAKSRFLANMSHELRTR
ncbi:MAG: hypothetical protein ACOZQL_14495 [Myxococcota bacterium]